MPCKPCRCRNRSYARSGGGRRIRTRRGAGQRGKHTAFPAAVGRDSRPGGGGTLLGRVPGLRDHGRTGRIAVRPGLQAAGQSQTLLQWGIPGLPGRAFPVVRGNARLQHSHDHSRMDGRSGGSGDGGGALDRLDVHVRRDRPGDRFFLAQRTAGCPVGRQRRVWRRARIAARGGVLRRSFADRRIRGRADRVDHGRHLRGERHQRDPGRRAARPGDRQGRRRSGSEVRPSESSDRTSPDRPAFAAAILFSPPSGRTRLPEVQSRRAFEYNASGAAARRSACARIPCAATDGFWKC